ncbi:Pectinesterase inhibitor domain - like 10 [Theobroma cacao]|uniref:DC1.2-like, putative n=1 Tax=Theobroma cacao TaxID=3641 RepID=A0A061G793_THECC|nr:DC1.2-like, putative [Theobroma cacao]WRX16965.1 Pectinesterase inhibitor domain - like 10 [Theobroma cacao]
MEGTFCSHSFKFLLILLAINSYINFSSAGRQIAPQSSAEFIRTSCSSTTYPKLCFETLSTHASLIQTSPQLLAHAALNVTLSTTESTSAMMVTLSKSHGLKPREAEAMQDCVEELSDSIDELRKSISEMGQVKGSNFGLMINDVQTWVSAALTDESTCSDGFQGNNMNGNVKTAVRTKILRIAHLTSNALALINNYASLHG